MAEKPSVDIGFRILQFREVSFSILSKYRELDESTSIQFFTNGKFQIIAEDSVAKVEITLAAKEMDLDDSPELFRLTTELSVRLEEGIKADETGMPQLPAQFVLNLMAVAYSSSRGVLCVRTQNTFFSKVSLPLIDAKGLLPSPPPEAILTFA